MRARVVKNSAWWSLWTIWVEIGAGFSPRRLQTYSSTKGGIWAKVPTAPEIFPTLIGLFRPLHPEEISLHLVIPEGHFQAEGDGFCMDAMGSADHEGFFILKGLLLEYGQELVDILEDQVRGLFQEQGQGSVEDIGRGESVMEVFREGTDIFSHAGQKGDDIVFRLFLDFIHPLNIKGGLLPDLFHGFPWNFTQFRKGLTGQEFNLKPGLKLSLLRPDPSHFRPGIS